MSTYPVLPLTLTWETQYSYQARVNQTRYKEGVDQRDRIGINLISEEIDARVTIQANQYQTVELFLKERRGRPFRLRSENLILDSADNIYICPEWSWQSLGFGAMQLSAKIQQVRVLGLIEELIVDIEEILQLLNGKADVSHTHTIGQVANLTQTLSGLQAGLSQLQQQLDQGLAAKVDQSVFNNHGHTIANISNLQATLDAKASQTALNTVQATLDTKASQTALNTVQAALSAEITARLQGDSDLDNRLDLVEGLLGQLSYSSLFIRVKWLLDEEVFGTFYPSGPSKTSTIGYSPADANATNPDRWVLVRNFTSSNSENNGIWYANSAGNWLRVPEFSAPGSIQKSTLIYLDSEDDFYYCNSVDVQGSVVFYSFSPLLRQVRQTVALIQNQVAIEAERLQAATYGRTNIIQVRGYGEGAVLPSTVVELPAGVDHQEPTGEGEGDDVAVRFLWKSNATTANIYYLLHAAEDPEFADQIQKHYQFNNNEPTNGQTIDRYVSIGTLIYVEQTQEYFKVISRQLNGDFGIEKLFDIDLSDLSIPMSEKGAANGVATLDGNGLVPSVQSRPSTLVYNSTNGTLTFTDAQETITAIDLPIENLFQSANYDAASKTLTLTTNGGGTIQVPLSDLVDLPEIVVATADPGTTPTTGQKLYLRSDTGEYWINSGGTWQGKFLTLTATERSKIASLGSLASKNQVADADIGDRTADDALVPSGLTGNLTQWLSWLTNRIKAITGKANWWTTPATTLEAAAAHAENTSNPHGVTPSQIGAATAAQGAKADTAVQPGNEVSAVGLNLQPKILPPEAGAQKEYARFTAPNGFTTRFYTNGYSEDNDFRFGTTFNEIFRVSQYGDHFYEAGNCTFERSLKLVPRNPNQSAVTGDISVTSDQIIFIRDTTDSVGYTLGFVDTDNAIWRCPRISIVNQTMLMPYAVASTAPTNGAIVVPGLGGIGVGGAGWFGLSVNAPFVGLAAQSSNPATPGTGLKLFADSTGRLSWMGTNGFRRTFDGMANTADRTYTLPDSSGTLALAPNISGWKVPASTSNNTAVTVTGVTTKTALATVSIPANTLTAGDNLKIEFEASCNNTAGSKTLSIEIAPTAGGSATVLFLYSATTTQSMAFARLMRVITQTTQRMFPYIASNSASYAVLGTAFLNLGIDFSVPQTITVYGQLTTSTDTLTFQGITLTRL